MIYRVAPVCNLVLFVIFIAYVDVFRTADIASPKKHQ